MVPFPGLPAQTLVVPAQSEAAALKAEAVSAATQVATAYPDDALSAALLGSAHYNIGHSAEASKHLRQCLALNPKLPDAYEILARIAYEKGDPQEAARLGREALKLGTPSPDLLNPLGRALLDLGEVEEAIRVLQQATRAPRSLGESHYLLGQARLQAGHLNEAKASFLEVLARQPEHTQACFGIFTVCQRLGETSDATRYRERFQQLEAQDRKTLADRSAQGETLSGLPMVRQTVARTLFGAGQVHRAHRQPEKAGELFRRAAALDPEPPAYRAALESTYVQRNALAEGVSAFGQLVHDQPTNQLNHLFLGRLQARLQHFEAAEQSFRQVQNLAPTWAEGYRALAEHYLRANRNLPQARQLAARAVELEPTGVHYELLAGACAKTDDRAAAIVALKRAIGLAPAEARYRKLLEQLEAEP